MSERSFNSEEFVEECLRVVDDLPGDLVAHDEPELVVGVGEEVAAGDNGQVQGNDDDDATDNPNVGNASINQIGGDNNQLPLPEAHHFDELLNYNFDEVMVFEEQELLGLELPVEQLEEIRQLLYEFGVEVYDPDPPDLVLEELPSYSSEAARDGEVQEAPVDIVARALAHVKVEAAVAPPPDVAPGLEQPVVIANEVVSAVGPSRGSVEPNNDMIRDEGNVEEMGEQLLFDDGDIKDISFHINSQDILNVNSQDLLKYGDIGTFSDNDDVLNKIFEDTKDDANNIQPLGMAYIMALKSGIDSGSHPSILFNEMPCFVNYAGDYGFDVFPAADGKKCIYEPSLNKLYLTIGTFELKVKLNWDSVPDNENLLLRTHVNFTQPAFQQLPVTKCMNCLTSSKKILDEENLESVEFVARATFSDSDAVYFRSNETSKLYLYQNVGSPELGCDTISKRLVFTCMNSCKSGNDGGGINRREVALVFTLLNKMHQVVGRRVFTLRICTAPHRDVKLDLEPKTKSKKRASGEEKGSQAKRPRKSTNYAEAIPGPSGNSVMVYQDNNVSSSQETCYSGDEDEPTRREGLLLRTLCKKAKQILQWKNSPDPRRRSCSRNLYTCLKLAQNIIRSAEPPADAGVENGGQAVVTGESRALEDVGVENEVKVEK